MNLTPQEIAKLRKASLHSFILSSEVKTSVVDTKLKELTSEIKQLLNRKNLIIDIFIHIGNK